MSELLIELGCEELPAGSVVSLAKQLSGGLEQHLSDARLYAGQAQVFATPRRIAARLSHVSARQSDTSVERRGPAMQAAYKDGEPTRALTGFLKSAGATLDDLETVKTDKGEWVAVRQQVAGKTLSEVLTQALPEIIKAMQMPRRMRWSDGPHEFLRPVSWLLAMHGSEALTLELFGLQATASTLGHRFHAPDAVELKSPTDYEQSLEAAYVIADPEKRRALTVTRIIEQAKRLGGEPVLDDDLIDEITALVEWPVALAGRFEEEFLSIPKEALIQTMQENQRYVALLDASGQLMPAFITVANLESKNPQTVIDGNERVIRPRFADTMFFWNQDKTRSLESWQPELDRVLFQEKLGTVADKVKRMGVLADWLCSHLQADAKDVQRAVALCKCDLNTEIVKELPKMQGICGRYYAKRDAETEAVVRAMEEHYFPNQAGGSLPSGSIAQIVALADKTDTLVGIFGAGMKPTGAKDPFALRRASIGIVRILLETDKALDLMQMLEQSASSYLGRVDSINTVEIFAFVQERFRGWLIDQSYSADAVDAVLAMSVKVPKDVLARVRAIEKFRQTEPAQALSAASKRMQNILNKVEQAIPEKIDQQLLAEGAEADLYEQLLANQDNIIKALGQGDYVAAMNRTAELRTPVDRFFDEVMVMDENPDIRGNRLALLQQINRLCNGTADLSLLRLSDTSGAGAGHS